MSYTSPLHFCIMLTRCRCWRTSRDGQVLNGALAAVIAAWLNYICLHKPFQHGNQIHSAGLRSALWLVSRGSSLQRSCTKLKYPLCGGKWHLCTQNDGWQKIKPYDGRKLGRTFTDWIICHLELLYNIRHDSFPTHKVLLLFRIRGLLIIKSPSWRLTESETNTIKS